MTSRWRVDARRLIAETIAAALEETPDLRKDLGALFLLVSNAYPFGERKHRPHRIIWLDELRLARAQLVPDGSPLGQPCAACGARRGKPCCPISDTDALITERDLATEFAPRREARKLAEQIVHAARRSPPSGPLFAPEAA